MNVGTSTLKGTTLDENFRFQCVSEVSESTFIFVKTMLNTQSSLMLSIEESLLSPVKRPAPNPAHGRRTTVT
jgi:hypothetical protein